MGPYGRQWMRYRRLNRVGILAFVLFLSVLPVIALLDRFAIVRGERLKVIFISSGLAALVLVAVFLQLISFFRCPRCGQYFSRRSKVLISPFISLGRACVHCGLGLYEGA